MQIIPKVCGKSNINFPEAECKDITFEGIENVTINQGVGIDLTEGVKAYDGDGNEIPFTVTPSEIAKCDVGEHTIEYKAVGKADAMIPHFPCGKNKIDVQDCNLVTETEDRLITIEQADPPVISGVENLEIDAGETVDLMNGVSAVDDNGNTVDVEFLGGVYDDEAEGSIASFETDLELPLKSLTADINPVQDLHGYDSPWVGGAGKNLFNKAGTDTSNGYVSGKYLGVDGIPTSPSSGIAWSISEYIKVSPSTAYTISGLPTTSSTSPSICMYDSDKTYTNSVAYGNRASFTFTTYATTEYVRISIPQAQIDAIQLEKGSTVTSYEPYENICPISGWDEVSVWRTGKNLAEISDINEPKEANTFVEFDSVLKSNTYVISFDITNAVRSITTNTNIMNIIDEDGGYHYIDAYVLKRVSDDARLLNISGTVNGRFYCVYTGTIKGISVYWRSNSYMTLTSGSATNFQIELGSTATDYELYQGNTYTTPLGSTYYGGTLDVVSGVLTVTHGRIASYNGETIAEPWISDRDEYVAGTTPTIGAEVVYPLATPYTVQLTPQEVDSLLGDNNVWADSGDVRVVFTKSIESEEVQFNADGIYAVRYFTEDECGNETDVTRLIYVGDNLDFDALTDENGTPLATEYGDILIARNNLLPYPYEDTTLTIGGVTFKDNGNGTITLNGTASSTYPLAEFVLDDAFVADGSDYLIKGTGSNDVQIMMVSNEEPPATIFVGAEDQTIQLDGTYNVKILPVEGKTFSNYTFIPIIRKA